MKKHQYQYIYDQDIIKKTYKLNGYVFFIISRSEEHTYELQSHHDIVCRLLLEKKKKKKKKKK